MPQLPPLIVMRRRHIHPAMLDIIYQVVIVLLVKKEHIKTALGQIHRVRIVRHWAVLQGLHRPLAQHQEHYVLYRLIHL